MKVDKIMIVFVLGYALGMVLGLRVRTEARVSQCIVREMRSDGIKFAYPGKLDEYDTICRRGK